MKRWALAFVLVVLSSGAAGSIYSLLTTPASDERCAMDWLARELSLDPDQYEKVWAVHTRRCPEIQELGGSAAEPACVEATELLIAEVSAVLRPEQAVKYRELISSCRQQCAAP